MKSSFLPFASIALCSALSAWSAPALACLTVHVPCTHAVSATPATPMFIPANATALPFDASWGDQVDGAITLRRAGQTTAESTFKWQTFSRTMAPLSKPLVAGQSYVLDASRQCHGASEPATVPLEVREAAPFPTSLGTLKLRRTRREPVQTLIGTSSCGGTRPGQVAELELDLSAEAQPWSASLSEYKLIVVDPPEHYAVRFVDGAWSFGKPDKLDMSVVCDLTRDEREAYKSSEQVPGKYRVIAQALLPTVETRYVESAPIDVALLCDDEEAETTRPVSNAREASDESAVETSVPSQDGDDGCNARGTSPSAQSNLAALLITALGVLMARKRHRKGNTRAA